MKKILVFLTIMVTLVGFSTLAIAEQDAQESGPYDPGFQQTEEGQTELMDFEIPLEGISEPGMLFSHFSQRPLLIYYFSPRCPHCINTFPLIQSVADEFRSSGLEAIAVSVGNSAKNDVRAFMNQQNVNMPMFQDASRDFSTKYGSGHVPMVVLVSADGKFIRYTKNGLPMLEALRKDLQEQLQN
jgi:peroxiredoxin